MKDLSRFTNQEVSELFKKARRALRHPGFDILCAYAKNKTGRILVITSAKVGSAPQRNKIRRRLKSIFLEEKLFERGLDCIVVVKKPGIELGFEELGALLRDALEVMDEA